jgi:L-fucose isomerase-like protein
VSKEKFRRAAAYETEVPNMVAKVGVLALARSTFDVPYAEEMAAKAFAALDRAGLVTTGPRTLLFDADAARAAMRELVSSGAEQLLILQVTFTDASTVVELAGQISKPLAIWAFPEPRTGGRLRLNAFCGLNLALHALGRAGHRATYLYRSPDAEGIEGAARALLTSAPRVPSAGPTPVTPGSQDAKAGHSAVAKLKNTSIGLVGEHPGGFDTCRFEDDALSSLAGVTVKRFALADVFDRAKSTSDALAGNLVREAAATLRGVDTVDQRQLNKSMRVYAALDSLAKDNACGAMAVRCWPEMFTEYGCAACGPMGMLNGQKIPAACEADVYGALTARLLQEIAGEPSWLVDIVDMDGAAGTGVLWHCGSAPLSMCDPDFKPEAQIHTNRKMPLLAQFPLKPGRITIARISQARNAPKMIVGGGTVVKAPMSYTGTSAVVKFDGGTEAAMRGLFDHALEHHVAIVYGEHQGAVRAAGAKMGLPVIELA